MEGQIVKNRSVLSPKCFWGSAVLLIILCATYWFPITYWLVETLGKGSLELPSQLSLRTWILRTLRISVAVALISTFAAYPVALTWRFSKYRTQRILIFMIVLPLVMGLLAKNFSWIGILSCTNPLSSLGFSFIGGYNILYTETSILIVMTSIFLPIAFFVIIQGLRAVKKEHIDAARALGTQDWHIVFSVVLPMSYRAMVLAFALIFAMSSGFFVTPRMMGGGNHDFISNVILAYVNYGRFDYASTLSLAFLSVLVIPLALIITYAVVKRRLIIGQ